jgi:hypothetical protein
MADGGKPVARKIVLNPGKYIREQAIALAIAGGATFLEQLLARGIGRDDARRFLLLVEHAPACQRRFACADIEQAELDAGRAGVEHQDSIGH